MLHGPENLVLVFYDNAAYMLVHAIISAWLTLVVPWSTSLRDNRSDRVDCIKLRFSGQAFCASWGGLPYSLKYHSFTVCATIAVGLSTNMIRMKLQFLS